ncbi:MAG: hypothetical protein NC203_12580 [Firmicutes bacterium]|nr:hypothetical protein [[Eubacterium] siraeum]MCM1489191.1 hypothetical protein [Bacillota bacterium]
MAASVKSKATVFVSSVSLTAVNVTGSVITATAVGSELIFWARLTVRSVSSIGTAEFWNLEIAG